jgi:hypothetical protein
MLDYAMAIAPYWYEALQNARVHEAGQRAWREKLREIERAERRAAARTPRKVVINKPSHLAGEHKMWI